MSFLKNVKVTTVAFSKNQYLVDNLLKVFPDAEVNLAGVRLNDDELVDYLKDTEAAIIGLELITENILKQLPNLKILAKYGVGLDNVDLKACEKYNVKIGWTGGVNKRSVAEMALGFMLSLIRNIYTTSNQLKQQNWNKNGGLQLTGKTIGIVGMGNIGRELVQLLKPFNCNILVNDVIDVSSYCIENNLNAVSIDELIEQADIITIHTPLTNLTYNLFNIQTFKKMKRSSFIINTARGGIINEADLKQALIDQIISGAAIDVYDPEPPIDEDLLMLPNLICTPHTGGNAYEAVVNMGLSAIEHLVKYRDSKRFEHNNE